MYEQGQAHRAEQQAAWDAKGAREREERVARYAATHDSATCLPYNRVISPEKLKQGWPCKAARFFTCVVVRASTA